GVRVGDQLVEVWVVGTDTGVYHRVTQGQRRGQPVRGGVLIERGRGGTPSVQVRAQLVHDFAAPGNQGVGQLLGFWRHVHEDAVADHDACTRRAVGKQREVGSQGEVVVGVALDVLDRDAAVAAGQRDDQ